MPKQPLAPLTPEQQAEQVAQFNHAFPGFANVIDAVQACSVTADEAVNAHRIVVMKLTSPVIEEPFPNSYVIDTLANDIREKHQQAVLGAIRRFLPHIESAEQLLPYVDRFSVESRAGQGEKYYYKNQCFLTIYPATVDVDETGKVNASFTVRYGD